MAINFQYQWLRDEAPIGGATSINYTITGGDLGHTLTLRVTGTTDTGVTVAISAGFVVPNATSAPVNQIAPVINSANVGETSTCSTGSWAGTSPITYTYQWYVNSTLIGGATSNSYAPTNGDAGKSLFCKVTATNSVGNASANSNTLTVASAPVLNPAPQYPTLLNTYVTRPAWSAVGVDYGAGYPTTVNLIAVADWTPPAGVDIDTGNHLIRVSGTNVTIFGIETTGWMIYYTGSGLTVDSCHWVGQTGGNCFIQGASVAVDAIIKNCILDGNSKESIQDTVISPAASGTWHIENNWIKNTWADGVTFNSFSPNSVLIELVGNLFDNVGAPPVTGIHGDALQGFGTANYTVDCTRNTWRQSNGTLLTQGFSIADADFQPTLQSGSYSENIFAFSGVQTDSGGVNWCVAVDRSETVGNVNIHNNYVDPTSLIVGFVFLPSGSGPHNGTVDIAGNINMLTGGVIS